MRERLNGHAQIGPLKSLERLASLLEAKARAVRDAIKIYGEHAGEVKRSTARTVLNGALELDAERRAGRPRRKRDGSFIARKRAIRRATADVLASLDAKTPRPVPGKGKVSALLQNGYIRRKGSGYVRTSKPFRVGDEA
jgi:hypothetical protein